MDQSFAWKDLPHLIHRWVGEVCGQNFAWYYPLWVRGLEMVLHNWCKKVRQGGFRCNKLVTISPMSAPHAGWRGWLDRELKMLLKCGMIAYWTTDMRGLISTSQSSRTSSLVQVTIRPGSAPPRLERLAGEGIKNSVEMRDDCLSDRRNARTILCRSDASDLCPLPCDDPSQVFPPTGVEGSWIGDIVCCWNTTQLPRTEDMRRLFSIVQTTRTSALSQVP